MIARGSVCWAELPGSGERRPVVVVQSEPFNQSRIPTMVVVPLATNLRLAEAPGNVLLPSRASRLTRDAVAVVSQVTTLERRLLRETPARLEGSLLAAVDEGLRLLLGILP